MKQTKKSALNPGVVGYILLMIAGILFWQLPSNCVDAVKKGNGLGVIFFEDGTMQIPVQKVAEALASFGSAIQRSGGQTHAGYENYKFTQSCRNAYAAGFAHLARTFPASGTSALLAVCGFGLVAAGFFLPRRHLSPVR